MLRELEQLEPEAICDALEISRKNLWVRLYRARIALAKCITRKIADDDGVVSSCKIKSNGGEV